MIPIRQAVEPPSFNQQVRVPGRQWLKNNGLHLQQIPPPKAAFEPYWRRCLTHNPTNDIYTSYGGICAYLGVYLEWTVGGITVDHFKPKSKSAARLAYEWRNYRLACVRMNARKSNHLDVLDPFQLAPDTFFLELVAGRIYPNSQITKRQQRRAQQTIDRLGLDDGECRRLRTDAYTRYICNAISESELRARHPFVWYEANRQDLL